VHKYFSVGHVTLSFYYFYRSFADRRISLNSCLNFRDYWRTLVFEQTIFTTVRHRVYNNVLIKRIKYRENFSTKIIYRIKPNLTNNEFNLTHLRSTEWTTHTILAHSQCFSLFTSFLNDIYNYIALYHGVLDLSINVYIFGKLKVFEKNFLLRAISLPTRSSYIDIHVKPVNV